MINPASPEAIFLAAYNQQRLHHGWLLAGVRASGKRAFADAAARFLLSHDSEAAITPVARFDDRHAASADRLFAAGHHPDLHVLQRLDKAAGGETTTARNITIDQVRALIRALAGSPAMSRYRVVLIDSLDDMERGAANALLKVLEEPPRDTIFLMISDVPGRLLPTIRSRCRTMRFGTEPPPLAADETMAPVLAIFDRIVATGDPDNVQRAALAKLLAGKANAPLFETVMRALPLYVHDRGRGGGVAPGAALAAWDAIAPLTQDAVRQSYDPAMIAYAVGDALALLARRG